MYHQSGDRHEGGRNWKKTFTWAQKKSKVMLYFISNEFYASDNCEGEVRDFSKMIVGNQVQASVVFALLDPGLDQRANRDMRELATKASEGGINDREIRKKFSTDNVFDLSEYMIWDDARREGAGGRKLNLRAAAKGMVALRQKIFELTGGKGDERAYLRDIEQGCACDDVVHDGHQQTKTGGYVRNRYKDDVRRIDINTADVNTLKERVPHIGDKRADEIVQLRKKLGGISCLNALAEIDGLAAGGTILCDMEPFVTFKSGKVGARSFATPKASPATDTKLAPSSVSLPPSPIKMPPLSSPSSKLTRGQLEGLKMDELKSMAAKRGITPDGDKRKTATWIEALL